MDDLMGPISPKCGRLAARVKLAKRIKLPLAIVDKRARRQAEIAEMTVIGDVTDRFADCGTIFATPPAPCASGEVLLENGAKDKCTLTSATVMSRPAAV